MELKTDRGLFHVFKGDDKCEFLKREWKTAYKDPEIYAGRLCEGSSYFAFDRGGYRVAITHGNAALLVSTHALSRRSLKVFKCNLNNVYFYQVIVSTRPL